MRRFERCSRTVQCLTTDVRILLCDLRRDVADLGTNHGILHAGLCHLREGGMAAIVESETLQPSFLPDRIPLPLVLHHRTVVHPREVYKSALLESAAAVVFLYNHPLCGDPHNGCYAEFRIL